MILLEMSKVSSQKNAFKMLLDKMPVIRSWPHCVNYPGKLI